MRLALLIATRYLFSKKSHSAINIISMISVCGVALITAALICTLSVFNGFENLVGSMLTDIQPEVKILPARGKTLDTALPVWDEIAQWDEVKGLAPVVEETVLAVYERQVPATIKGVPLDYNEIVPLDRTIINGEYLLQDPITSYAIVGAGIGARLEAGAYYSRPLELYAPQREGRVNLANPSGSFMSQRFFVAASFFTNQAEYDDNIIYIPLDEARALLNYTTEASHIELATMPSASTAQVLKKLQALLGEEYIIQDRLMQNDEMYRWIRIEKWITFLILAFMLLIATFNIVGSLSMLIVDKQNDIATLRKLGANDRLITNIFMAEGWLISMLGALSGLTVGVLLCWLQQEYGLLKLGGTGSFIVESYPIQLQWSDTLIVTGVVLLLGAITAGYPAKILRRKLEKKA